MPVLKRPCANCPFRNDGKGVPLRPKRLESIIDGLLKNDFGTFNCHKTLDTEPQTCAGAMATLHKLGRLPFVGRLAIEFGVIEQSDLEASKAMVIDPNTLELEAMSRWMPVE
jgi:hypothetical protein